MRSLRADVSSRRKRVRPVAAVLLLSGLCLAVPALGVFAQPLPIAQPSSDKRFAAFINEASRRFHIPEEWIRAVMHAESEYVSDVSSAGAMGLMQIMPDTWTELRARYTLGADPFDPHDNIVGGAAYLREMLDRYGNVAAMLAAYNAGPRRYDDYLATGRALPAETRNYVAKLAPLLGGTTPADSTPALTSRPADWREAPLFIAVAGARSPVGASQSDGQSTASPAAAPIDTDGGPAASTGAIFVPVAGRHSTP